MIFDEPNLDHPTSTKGDLMQQFPSTPPKLSFANRLPLLPVARNGFRSHGGQEENYGGVKSLIKCSFMTWANASACSCNSRFSPSSSPLLSPKTFGPLSLAAFFLYVFSEKGWRARECSSRLRFHDDSRILNGHPIDDDDDEPSTDGAEASA